jgi:hypothetical protein
MNVVSFVSYCGHPLLNAEMGDAGYFIKAMKKHGKTEPHLATLSRRCTLDTRTQREGLDWFGRLAAWVIEVEFPSPHMVLVPVPNSDCSLENRNVPRTRRLADAIANKVTTATVFDCLRWIHDRRPSHLGGSREPRILSRELALIHIPLCAAVVLVDDVVTTGAHLQAAAAKLSAVGVKCDHAICLARTEVSGLHAFALKKAFVPEIFVSSSNYSGSQGAEASLPKASVDPLQCHRHLGECTL